MKPITTCLFTIIIFLFVLISCSKSEVRKKSGMQVEGKWKLTESLIDIGNGKAKWTKVTESNGGYPYIKFKNNIIESNIFVDMRRYQVIDSAKLKFTFYDNRKMEYRYTLENATLVLNPPCIEGCGYRFVKAD